MSQEDKLNNVLGEAEAPTGPAIDNDFPPLDIPELPSDFPAVDNVNNQDNGDYDDEEEGDEEEEEEDDEDDEDEGEDDEDEETDDEDEEEIKDTSGFYALAGTFDGSNRIQYRSHPAYRQQAVHTCAIPLDALQELGHRAVYLLVKVGDFGGLAAFLAQVLLQKDTRVFVDADTIIYAASMTGPAANEVLRRVFEYACDAWPPAEQAPASENAMTIVQRILDNGTFRARMTDAKFLPFLQELCVRTGNVRAIIALLGVQLGPDDLLGMAMKFGRERKTVHDVISRSLNSTLSFPLKFVEAIVNGELNTDYLFGAGILNCVTELQGDALDEGNTGRRQDESEWRRLFPRFHELNCADAANEDEEARERYERALRRSFCVPAILEAAENKQLDSVLKSSDTDLFTDDEYYTSAFEVALTWGMYEHVEHLVTKYPARWEEIREYQIHRIATLAPLHTPSYDGLATAIATNDPSISLAHGEGLRSFGNGSFFQTAVFCRSQLPAFVRKFGISGLLKRIGNRWPIRPAYAALRTMSAADIWDLRNLERKKDEDKTKQKYADSRAFLTSIGAAVMTVPEEKKASIPLDERNAEQQVVDDLADVIRSLQIGGVYEDIIFGEVLMDMGAIHRS